MKKVTILAMLALSISATSFSQGMRPHQVNKVKLASRELKTPISMQSALFPDDTNHVAYLTAQGGNDNLSDNFGKATILWQLVTYSGNVVRSGQYTLDKKNKYDDYSDNNLPFEAVAESLGYEIKSGEVDIDVNISSQPTR